MFWHDWVCAIMNSVPCDAQGGLQLLSFFHRCLHSWDFTGAWPVDLHICLCVCSNAQLCPTGALQTQNTDRTSGTWKSLGCQSCPSISRFAFGAGMEMPDYCNRVGEMKQPDLETRHWGFISLLFCPPAKGTQNPASPASLWHWVITNPSLRFD